MIIRFERTGGFTAIPLRVVIDTASLDPGDDQNFRKLIDTAGFFRLPEKLNSPSGNDRFNYKVTVEDTGKGHSIEIGDSALTETLQPLIQRLESLARTQRQPKP